MITAMARYDATSTIWSYLHNTAKSDVGFEDATHKFQIVYRSKQRRSTKQRREMKHRAKQVRHNLTTQ